jgi:hypothetical protein
MCSCGTFTDCSVCDNSKTGYVEMDTSTVYMHGQILNEVYLSHCGSKELPVLV